MRTAVIIPIAALLTLFAVFAIEVWLLATR
jgi:hypothetical protein